MAQSPTKELCHIGGLQKVCCIVTMGLTEFQILSLGDGHWLLVADVDAVHSTVLCESHVYSIVNRFVQMQIISLIACFKEVYLEFGADCGMFAIAYATAALNYCLEGFHFMRT